MFMAANWTLLTSHAPARVRIGTPSARAEASAHAPSRPACSSPHPARQTRASTRRLRHGRADQFDLGRPRWVFVVPGSVIKKAVAGGT